MGESKPFKPVKLIMESSQPDLISMNCSSRSSPLRTARSNGSPIRSIRIHRLLRPEMGRRPDRFFVVFRDLVDPSVLLRANCGPIGSKVPARSTDSGW